MLSTVILLLIKPDPSYNMIPVNAGTIPGQQQPFHEGPMLSEACGIMSPVIDDTIHSP